MEKPGFFVISLDFELYWGVRDAVKLENYRENIKNVPVVIPAILDLFTKYDISATWCVVGFLFFENKEQLLKNLPKEIPSYTNTNFDQYNYIFQDDLEPVYHFAPATIKLIQQTNKQEIGTHTFSHFFCLEKGQQPQQFQADIEQAISILAKWNIDCNSIVFPRNQYDEGYLTIAKKNGIRFYRGNEKSWFYQHKDTNSETKRKRFSRLLDAYINISGYNTFLPDNSNPDLPTNIPSSSFLRPYNRSLKMIENIRFKRIADAMSFAAKHKRGYHLWWHPHNFGKNIAENLQFLERILKHYQQLNKKYGFISKAMNEC